jgi:SNF2 family DNA or RNA helicase
MKFEPHSYQQEAIGFAAERERSALIMDPGLGKTVSTLSVLKAWDLLGLISKTLVIAPLRVVYSVWGQEIEKWDHLGQTISIVHGTPAQRLKALEADADLYLINPEGLVWIEGLKAKQRPGWDCLVVDESTKFKSPKSRRFRALRKMLKHFDRRVILTGTPTPRSYEDLWAQIYILDEGKTFGSLTQYRHDHFKRGGFEAREWFLRDGEQEKIADKIRPLSLRLDNSCLDLPEKLEVDHWVDLPPKARKSYDQMEKEFWAELGGAEVLAFGGGSQFSKLRQLANGGVYTSDLFGGEQQTLESHEAKIDVVESLAEELQGRPLLILYRYKHDLERLSTRFGSRLKSIGGHTSTREGQQLVDLWNFGEVELLACHPASMGHGLNMQAAGNDIAWLGVPDDLEHYDQANARIYRQGVTGGVRIHRILARDTVDEVALRRLVSKDFSQSNLLNLLKERESARV